jgi:hypothetical protein
MLDAGMEHDIKVSAYGRGKGKLEHSPEAYAGH